MYHGIMHPRVQIPLRAKILKYYQSYSGPTVHVWKQAICLPPLGKKPMSSSAEIKFQAAPNMHLQIFTLTGIWTMGCIIHSRWPTNVPSSLIGPSLISQKYFLIFMWFGRRIFGRTGQEVRRSFPPSAQNNNWKKKYLNYNVISWWHIGRSSAMYDAAHGSNPS